MQLRRLSLTGAVLVLALAVPATMAVAEGAAVFTSPANDATIGAPVAIEAEVTGDTSGLFGGGDHVVEVRLADLAQQPIPGLARIELQCTGGDCGGDSTWGGATFDPATFAPFGAPEPACNGGYVLQARVDEGSWSGQRIVVAAPPSAPTDVAAEPGVETATVTWRGAPQPDVTGYRVQRRTGGSWTTIGETGAQKTSLVDGAAPAGDVQYRVLTLRADGRSDGAAASPCSDTGRDLTAASDAVTTTVEADRTTAPDDGGTDSGSGTDDGRPSRPSPTPTEEEPTGDDTPTDSGDEQVSGGGGTSGSNGSDGGTGGDAGDGAAEDEASEPAPRRRAGSRIAPPAAVDTGTRRSDVSVPRFETGNDGPQVAEERYYGQDGPFDEELDFGDADPVAGRESGTRTVTETRTVRVPGALQSVLGEELELSRILHPLAIGLLMLTLALHLRRWTREGATV